MTKLRLWLARLLLPAGWCAIEARPVSRYYARGDGGKIFAAGIATESVSVGEIVTLEDRMSYLTSVPMSQGIVRLGDSEEWSRALATWRPTP